MNHQTLFANRVGVLATMHRKENAIAPILERELGIKLVVPPDFDTDRFGTFTREVKRQGTQIEAARFKAESALAVTGETLGFASEGTFGPHPAVPYISCNREIVILLDKENDIEIIGEAFSLETNHNHQVVHSIEEAYKFAEKVGFPEHGLVVMFDDSPQDNNKIFKGITREDELVEAVRFVLKHSLHRKAHIETDMRALYNPTRMKNIEKATLDLVKKLNCFCPQCSWPGFTLIQRKKGLPCAVCQLPSQLTLATIHQCKKCGFSQEILFPDGIEAADPSQCLYCNP